MRTLLLKAFTKYYVSTLGVYDFLYPNKKTPKEIEYDVETTSVREIYPKLAPSTELHPVIMSIQDAKRHKSTQIIWVSAKLLKGLI